MEPKRRGPYRRGHTEGGTLPTRETLLVAAFFLPAPPSLAAVWRGPGSPTPHAGHVASPTAAAAAAAPPSSLSALVPIVL